MRSSAFLASIVAATRAVADTVWATPHDSFSSSVGVLGCKINTNRVAYWPPSVNCSNICVSLSYQGRSVYLLRIDQSGGAHDVSYDAWNYLVTGSGATEDPTAGGAIAMETADVDMSNCLDLINTDGNKLPFSAANSMNFITSCLADPSSWVANNYVLYNILDSICTWGKNEVCTLDYPTYNQPTCPDTLGVPTVLTGEPVWNIQYPTGKKVLATSGGQGNVTEPEPGASDNSSSAKSPALGATTLAILFVLMSFIF